MVVNRAGSLLAASAAGERATGRQAWRLLWASSRPLAAGVIAWMVAGALFPVAVVTTLGPGRRGYPAARSRTGSRLASRAPADRDAGAGGGGLRALAGGRPGRQRAGHGGLGPHHRPRPGPAAERGHRPGRGQPSRGHRAYSTGWPGPRGQPDRLLPRRRPGDLGRDAVWPDLRSPRLPGRWPSSSGGSGCCCWSCGSPCAGSLLRARSCDRPPSCAAQDHRDAPGLVLHRRRLQGPRRQGGPGVRPRRLLRRPVPPRVRPRSRPASRGLRRLHRARRGLLADRAGRLRR